MKFGHLLYPVSYDSERDSEVIDLALSEGLLAEELGLDSVWLTEHYFSGETAYADPVVFAGALAVRTTKVLLGFAVVEMALHNPVHLATQMALLDNLSHGRLLVGTGRGSNFNAFEYAGFGTTVQEGLDSIDEAEDLLIKAWTTDNLEHQGRSYSVSVPAIRPRPYQKPHPPVARACLSDASVAEMARKGRLVLFRCRSIDGVRKQIQLYRESMLEAGFSEEYLRNCLEQCWVWADAYLAESDQRAFDEFLPAFEGISRFLFDVRERWNPESQPVPPAVPPLAQSAYRSTPDPTANELFVGSPKRVAEQVAMLRDGGATNLMIANRGVMTPEQSANSLRLFSDQVAPLFR